MCCVSVSVLLFLSSNPHLRAAFLIGQDGIIREAQEWFNRDSMVKAIRSL